MPVAFSYIRFSSLAQASGDSVRRQEVARDKWLAEHPDVTLDTTLALTDAGRSGYDRDEEEFDTYALGQFVELVKRKKVPSGSYLLLENLDRLSREDEGTATELLLSIVNRGVTVVQLIPEEMVFRKPVNMINLIRAVLELSRGHSESVIKSKRVCEAWGRKQDAAANGKRVTALLPCWVKLVDGKMVIDPVAGRGGEANGQYGAHAGVPSAIARTLHDEGVPTLGRKTLKLKKRRKAGAEEAGTEEGGTEERAVKWTVPTVHAILRSRALMGDYVAYGARNRNRHHKPSGKPVPNYYPALLTETEFLRVQDALTTRNRIGRGRPGRHVNLFGGLLREPLSGNTMTYGRNQRDAARLIPIGRVDTWVSFPAESFERAILSEMSELKAADLEDCTAGAPNRLEELRVKIRDNDALTVAWKAKMNDVRIVDTVAAKLAELGAEGARLCEELGVMERESSSCAAESLDEIRTFAAALAENPDDETGAPHGPQSGAWSGASMC